MQPKRDPNDIRYWPRSEGGKGFPRTDSAPSKRFAALRTYDQHRNLMADDTTQTNVSMVADYSPDTVQSRARAAIVLAIEKLRNALADDEQTQTVQELATSINALGRIGGVQSVDIKQTGSIQHLHLAALQAANATRANALPRATATLLATVNEETRTGEAPPDSVATGRLGIGAPSGGEASSTPAVTPIREAAVAESHAVGAESRVRALASDGGSDDDGGEGGIGEDGGEEPPFEVVVDGE